MTFDVPSEDFRALAEPLLKGVAAQLAGELAKAAEQLASDRLRGPMNKPEAADYLRISVRCLEEWMKPEGEGGKDVPHYFPSHGQAKFYREDLDAWIRQEKFRRNPIAVLHRRVA